MQENNEIAEKSNTNKHSSLIVLDTSKTTDETIDASAEGGDISNECERLGMKKSGNNSCISDEKAKNRCIKKECNEGKCIKKESNKNESIEEKTDNKNKSMEDNKNKSMEDNKNKSMKDNKNKSMKDNKNKFIEDNKNKFKEDNKNKSMEDNKNKFIEDNENMCIDNKKNKCIDNKKNKCIDNKCIYEESNKNKCITHVNKCMQKKPCKENNYVIAVDDLSECKESGIDNHYQQKCLCETAELQAKNGLEDTKCITDDEKEINTEICEEDTEIIKCMLPMVDDLIDKSKEESPFEDYSPDKRFGRLPIIIGHGSQKLVYKAIDTYDATEVAWNILEITECPQNFLNEINLLKTINHPNIIRLKESWFTEKHLIFITELVTSGSLRDYIKNVAPTIRIIRSWAKQVLLAIEHLHTKMMIHRDIKCENIFINGSTGEVKIGDLGMARLGKQRRYTLVGTPEFMAREVFEGYGYGEGVDVHAFGMALIEMYTGEYPYKECDSSHDIFRRVIAGVPPQGLFTVTNACLRNLIISCILPEEERFSMTKCMEHHFIGDENSDKILEDIVNLDKCEEGSAMSNLQSGCSTCLSYLKSFTFTKTAPPTTTELTLIAANNHILHLQLYYKEGDQFIKFDYNISQDTVETITQEMIAEKIFDKNQLEFLRNIISKGINEIKEKIIKKKSANEILMKWANNEDFVYLITEKDKEEVTLIAQKLFDTNEKNILIKASDSFPTTPTLVDLDFPKNNYEDEHTVEEFVKDTANITKRDVDVFSGWIKKLKDNEIYHVGDLRILTEEDWDALDLTIFSERAMKNMLYGKDRHPNKEKDLTPNSYGTFEDDMKIEDFVKMLCELVDRKNGTEWTERILKEDVRNLKELRSLALNDWERLGLCVYASRVIKNVVFKKGKISKNGKII